MKLADKKKEVTLKDILDDYEDRPRRTLDRKLSESQKEWRNSQLVRTSLIASAPLVAAISSGILSASLGVSGHTMMSSAFFAGMAGGVLAGGLSKTVEMKGSTLHKLAQKYPKTTALGVVGIALATTITLPGLLESVNIASTFNPYGFTKGTEMATSSIAVAATVVAANLPSIVAVTIDATKSAFSFVKEKLGMSSVEVSSNMPTSSLADTLSIAKDSMRDSISAVSKSSSLKNTLSLLESFEKEEAMFGKKQSSEIAGSLIPNRMVSPGVSSGFSQKLG